MTDDFSLASPAGHLIMGDGSGPDGLATKDGAKALSRAVSVDTATTQLHTPSSTKNLIIEYQAMLGVPVPDATQWDQIEVLGDCAYNSHSAPPWRRSTYFPGAFLTRQPYPAV